MGYYQPKNSSVSFSVAIESDLQTQEKLNEVIQRMISLDNGLCAGLESYSVVQQEIEEINLELKMLGLEAYTLDTVSLESNFIEKGKETITKIINWIREFLSKISAKFKSFFGKTKQNKEALKNKAKKTKANVDARQKAAESNSYAFTKDGTTVASDVPQSKSEEEAKQKFNTTDKDSIKAEKVDNGPVEIKFPPQTFFGKNSINTMDELTEFFKKQFITQANVLKGIDDLTKGVIASCIVSVKTIVELALSGRRDNGLAEAKITKDLEMGPKLLYKAISDFNQHFSGTVLITGEFGLKEINFAPYVEEAVKFPTIVPFKPEHFTESIKLNSRSELAKRTEFFNLLDSFDLKFEEKSMQILNHLDTYSQQLKKVLEHVNGKTASYDGNIGNILRTYLGKIQIQINFIRQFNTAITELLKVLCLQYNQSLVSYKGTLDAINQA